MRMRSRLKRVVERYGRPVMLHTADGDYAIKALLNPYRGRSRFSPNLEGTRIGRMDKREMSFAAPAEGAALLLCEGDFVSTGTRRYFVRRCEAHYLGEEPFYVWAVLTRTEGGAA